MPGRVLLIGIGNPMRHDDGFGATVIEHLEKQGLPDAVQCLVVHQLTPELAEDLAAVARVVFIDACIPDSSHACAVCVAPLNEGAIEGTSLSHGFGPGTLMRLTRQLHGHAPAAWFLSAPASDLGHGEGLSATCQVYAAEAVQVIQAWLEGTTD